MRWIVRTAAAGLAATVMAGPLSARDLALVLINSDEGGLFGAGRSQVARLYRTALEGEGFTVFSAAGQKANRIQNLAAEFADAAAEEDENRIVIVMAGRFVQGAENTWFLGPDAASDLSVFHAGAQGLPLAPLLALAGSAEGKAVMLLSPDESTEEPGRGLTSGLETQDLPQGVTVAQGPVMGLLSLLKDQLLADGASYATARENAPRGVEMSGYISDEIGLAKELRQARPEPAPALDPGEQAYWSAVRDIGTAEAFGTYLERYPQGEFAADARARVAALRDAPRRRAEEAETAINLTQDQRRQVQRDLDLLGFDPRGIDGVFGPGSRRAIGEWQAARGLSKTGYITADQRTRLRSEAAARAQELEAEARQRRDEEERRDEAFWQQGGADGGEAELRAYLERYPDGLHAEEARLRLRMIEDRRRDAAEGTLRAAWDRARAEDSIPAYADFLRRYPDSTFTDAAEARIAELRDPTGRPSPEAEREEAQILVNDVARVLAERRLSQMGLEPGPVDGAFTAETRRALRRFQRERGLTVTGYIDRATFVHLLAG